MAMTTRSSISVKPFCLCITVLLLIKGLMSIIGMLIFYDYNTKSCDYSKKMCNQGISYLLNFIYSGKFSNANSPWYFFAALSYSFAACFSSLKYPRNLYLPLTCIRACHFFLLLRQLTPFYFEDAPFLLMINLLKLFCARVAGRMLAFRLSRPL